MVWHEVVIVGAGHNGLTVAAYLAKAGVDVCVLERQDIVGGAVCTRELTLPGFKHDLGSVMHAGVVANPLIHVDELGLKSKYGLKYVFSDLLLAFLFPDGSTLIFYRDIDKTCESIARFSARDAAAYPRFLEAQRKIMRAGALAYFSPTASFGRFVSFADASEEGREFLRILLSSTATMVSEWFESEQLKTAICRWSGEHMLNPREQGSAYSLFSFDMLHRWGYALPEGGSGMLSEALAACVRDNGGTIRLCSPVRAIKVESGEARGVVLDGKEEVVARKAVVSNLNVKQLFLEMLKPDELPPGFQERVRRLRHSSFSALVQHVALNDPPLYRLSGDDQVNQAWCAMVTPSSLEELLRMSEDESTFGIPGTQHPSLVCGTILDPTRAPKGKHTLYVYHLQPYSLKNGGAARWDDIKQGTADAILDEARKYTTGLSPENILGRFVMSPLDLERYDPALVHGDVLHIGGYATQLFGNRPLPGWSQYRTPIKRLYMCGASTHPGGGVSGGGRAAVQAIMEDLGIDFKKVIGR